MDECREEKKLLEEEEEGDDDVIDTVVEIDEEKVTEVMKRLEQEISYPSSYYYQSSPFVAIDGNDDESCGPSFSDSSSTVMAALDVSGCSFLLPLALPVVDGLGLSGLDPELLLCSGSEADEGEEWFARVMEEEEMLLL